MKTIAVTGHTDGLGSAIIVEFARYGDAVQGFDLTTGHDITNEADRQRIVDAVQDVDVFVNCAYSRKTHDTAQVHLFTALYDRWKDEDKHIINIGSIAPSWTTGPFITDRSLYRASKAALDVVADEASMLRNKCRVTTVRPDWIESVELSRLEKQYGRKAPNPLKYQDVATLVHKIVELGDMVTITSVTLKGTIT